MIRLSKRLGCIADFIGENDSVIDIGCDHALLDIYLAQKSKERNLLAADINENALKGATRNINKYKLSDYIVVVASNGLEKINTANYNMIVVSGMGAHTIVGILYSSMKNLNTIDTLIIQSNNELDFLRYKVTKIGYYIFAEKLIEEQGIIYTVIVFKKGKRFYNKKQLLLGPILLKERSELFKKKNEKELAKLKIFYSSIPNRYFRYKLKVYLKMKLYQKNISD